MKLIQPTSWLVHMNGPSPELHAGHNHKNPAGRCCSQHKWPGTPNFCCRNPCCTVLGATAADITPWWHPWMCGTDSLDSVQGCWCVLNLYTCVCVFLKTDWIKNVPNMKFEASKYNITKQKPNSVGLSSITGSKGSVWNSCPCHFSNTLSPFAYRSIFISIFKWLKNPLGWIQTCSPLFMEWAKATKHMSEVCHLFVTWCSGLVIAFNFRTRCQTNFIADTQRGR